MFGDFNISSTGSVYRNMRNPVFLKNYYKFKTLDLIKGNEIKGSSPPDIFVGRIGYPNVYIGPLVPPVIGDTTVMGTPENWVGKSIPEIVEMRSMLIRGMYKARVTNTEGGKIVNVLQDIAMAERYMDIGVKLSRMPSQDMVFDEHSQPFGPSAPLKEIELGNIKANRYLENAYFDTAMPASDGIKELYDKGLLVSKIQKALSAGILGRKTKRRFVPTRWSITATDDTLSKYKLESVKQYGVLDSIKVYENVALDNRWVVVMVPGAWEYESMEAWYPNTTWNLKGKDIEMGASYEPYGGRKTYAEIGGCYYAARLAVTELLDRVKAQAKAIILREVHSGYIMPVGVWNVREHLRDTFKKEPKSFSDMKEVFSYITKRLDIPLNAWVRHSTLLKNLLYQKTLAAISR